MIRQKSFLYVTLDQKKHIISLTGIFVAIANNTLYGSKLLIFLLCQKSLGYYVKIMFHGDILYISYRKYTILPTVLGHPLLMNRFDYFSNFYEYKS